MRVQAEGAGVWSRAVPGVGGVSQTVGLAYLVGFFHANLRRLPDVACRVAMLPSEQIIAGLRRNQ